MDVATQQTVIAAEAALHTSEAPVYDHLHPELTNRSETKRLERMVTNAAKALPSDAPTGALDLGAGTGFVTEHLLDWGFTVTAVDVSPAMIARLKRKHAHAVAKKRVRLGVEDVDTFLITHGERYSIVAASALLHRLPDPSSTFGLVAARLVPGGSFLIFHEPLIRPVTFFEAILRRLDWSLARLYVISWDDLDAIRQSSGPLAATERGLGFDEETARDLAKRHGFKVVSFERHVTAQSALVRWLLRWLVGSDSWCMVLRKPR